MNHPNIASAALLGIVASLGSPAAWSDTLLERNGYRPLVADQRAFRPGDNLTVLITESAAASTTATTTTNKEGAVSGTLSASRDGTNPYTRGLTAAAEIAEDFKGGGRIERAGKLLARMTVVVQSVEANGNLRVKGDQEIFVNEEKQRISLEGSVRPQDILTDNTVLSTRLSQAKIELTGQGLLAEKQKPGILTRFLSWLGIL
jgi:flagellar L-ring protein precursor FlgH